MSWLDAFINSAPTGPATGSLGGTYPAPIVTQVDGSSGAANVLVPRTIFGSSTAYPLILDDVSGVSVSTTPLTLDSYPQPDLTTVDYEYTIVGRDTGNGDSYRGTFYGSYNRNAGAPSVVAAWASSRVSASGGAVGWTVAVAVSGNNHVVTVTGNAGRTINWTVYKIARQRG